MRRVWADRVCLAGCAQSIETAILEVQEVFGQLANVISEQGQSVERIDENVETAVRRLS